MPVTPALCQKRYDLDLSFTSLIGLGLRIDIINVLLTRVGTGKHWREFCQYMEEKKKEMEESRNKPDLNRYVIIFMGFGKKPPREAIQKLAEDAGFANWEQARICIQQIVDTLTYFPKLAQEISVSKTIQKEIEQTLTERRKSNALLFAR
ncbi:hypothetical protein AB7102_09455 [Providencia manganoxydans]